MSDPVSVRPAAELLTEWNAGMPTSRSNHALQLIVDEHILERLTRAEQELAEIEAWLCDRHDAGRTERVVKIWGLAQTSLFGGAA